MSQLRFTNQREAIVEFLKKEKHHPTASEVYKAVKEKLPRISRGTVYRNLEVLCKERIVRQVLVRGTSRFESMHEGHHDHFICNKCNKIIDIQSRPRSIEGLKSQLPNTEIEQVTLNITGTCSACKGG